LNDPHAPCIDAAATLVVTRPQPDADRLCDALRERGRRAIAFPVLGIEPPDDDAALRRTMARIGDYRLVVFVSPNAVRRALAHRTGPWPPATTIGVMGPGSRAALEALGVEASGVRIVSPAERAVEEGAERFDSESLFAALDEILGLSAGFDGRALILRGNGGRAWFADRLRSLGIGVDEVEAYRRVRPDPTVEACEALKALFARGEPVAFVVTSSAGVAHLEPLVERALAGAADAGAARTWLRSMQLVAPHRRIAEVALAAGYRRVAMCGVGDAGILAAIE